MKKISQLSVPKQVDADFPNGAIINETDTQDGTPVIREIYNDVLVNLYKLLDVTGITANGNEDSETNGYQIIEALRKLANTQNDIEQVLTLTGSFWSVPFELEILPNKYFFFARPTDGYNSALSYTFKGSGSTVIPLTSPSGFNLNDELLVIIDNSTVRVYSLSILTSSSSNVPTTLGSPISFNNSSKMYYFESGNLLSDVPKINLIQSTIRTEFSNGTINVLDMFVLKGKLLCFCVVTDTKRYAFFQFNLTDFDSPEYVDYPIPDIDNFYPYCYTDGDYVYLTNNGNTNSDNFKLVKINYDEVNAIMTNNSDISLDASFVKTTNTVITSNKLITLVNGVLDSYSLISGIKTNIAILNGVNGQLFMFNGSPYFCSGEIAQKWIL